MVDNSPQRWLAYELHDGLLQWVIGARLQLIAAQNRTEPSIESYHRSVSKAISSLEMALVEARELIGYLEQQPARGETRIATALIKFIDGAQRDAELHGQHIVAHIELSELGHVEQTLSDAISWNLLRITQQAIRNAITHAGPTRIDVQLRFVAEAHELVLIVEDHGRGFDTSRSTSETHSFGLSSMSHRAQLIGASFEIQSAIGAGCRVRCALPIGQTSN